MEPGKTKPLDFPPCGEIEDENVPEALEVPESVVIGKPKRVTYYYFKVFKGTHKVFVKPEPDGYGEELYYVYPAGSVCKELALRGLLKQIRPILCQDRDTGEIRLWPVKISQFNSYYDSLAVLMTNKDVETRAWMVTANQAQRKYDIYGWRGDDEKGPSFPEKDESVWMSEAFPESRIIGPDERDHPAIANLFEGELLK